MFTTLKSEKKVVLHGFLQELSDLFPLAMEPLVAIKLWGPAQGWNSPLLCFTQRKAIWVSKEKSVEWREVDVLFSRLQSIWCGFLVTGGSRDLNPNPRTRREP